MLSQREAKKELFGYFYTNWKDGLANGLPNSSPALSALTFTVGTQEYTPEVFFPHVEKRQQTPTDKHFAKINMLNFSTPQTSLPGGRSSGGGVKFTTSGICIVQLFFSKSNYSSVEEDFLTAIAHEMFMAKSSENIWFRRPTVTQKPEEERHLRSDVDIEYTFDTYI